MAKRVNCRTKGNGYERAIVNELKDLGYNVATSRNESRSMDAQKVDIVSLGEKKLPFHVQCKSYTGAVKYWEILDEMPDDIPPVIFHKKTEKKNVRFVTKGEFVIMKKSDFYKALSRGESLK